MDSSFKNNNFLIEQLIKGEEDAYVFLVNAFNKKLFVYALSLTKDHAMSKDIVQNVFLRTWEFRQKLNTAYSLKNFLYKSTYNEFINQYHRNQSISILEQAYVDALQTTLDDSNSILLEKKIAIVTKEIEHLPAKCKQAFLLSKKEGLTNIEIAEYLNVSVKAVEAQITKAYSLLRKAIGNKIKLILFSIFGIRKK